MRNFFFPLFQGNTDPVLSDDFTDEQFDEVHFDVPEVVPEPPAPPTLSLEAAKEILAQIEKVGTDAYAVDPRCQHCKGIHDRACPRVHEMQFSPAGGLIAVRFWKEWDSSNVLWPEDIVAIVMDAEELESKKE